MAQHKKSLLFRAGLLHQEQWSQTEHYFVKVTDFSTEHAVVLAALQTL
jgi:hypothetical protein